MIIRENVLLSELTTMRLGGPAKFVIDIEKESEIPEAYAFAKEHNLPTFILGDGANTIAHDEGFNGVILRNAIIGINEESNSVELRPYATNEESKSVGSRPYSMNKESNSVELRPYATNEESKLVGSRPYATNEERNERSSARDDGPERASREPTDLDYHIITAYGGTTWDDVVDYACKHGLTGIEAMSKIPGTAGAAPVQNIGAYGQDISAVLDHATAYDTSTEQFVTLSHADFGFSYRKSILNTTAKDRYFIISITLKLEKGEMSRPFYNSIEKYISEHHETDFSPLNIRKIVSTIRADKLPDPATTPSAGSFFKNIYLTEEEARQAEQEGIPVYHGHDGIKINSGWLIDQAGLKGKLLHGIRINEKASLVLINESAKSYQDLATARAEIIDAVKSKFGYTLEQEPMEIPQ